MEDRDPVAMRPRTDARRSPGVASAESRAALAEATGGAPQMTFEGATPYDQYVRTDVLHGIQETMTDQPEERAFLVASQIMELYFGQLRFEWELAQQHLRKELSADPAFAKGLSTAGGRLVSAPVAEAHGYSYDPVADDLD